MIRKSFLPNAYRISTVITYLCFCWPCHVSAVTQQPDAGSLLKDSSEAPRQLPTAPTTDIPLPEDSTKTEKGVTSSTAFVLKGVKFVGNTVFSTEQLNKFTADMIGKRVTFGELEILAQRVTAHYQENGYALALAIIPHQEIRDGVVEFSIIEGALGKIHIKRAQDAPVSEKQIADTLALLQPGSPIRQETLERALLLLSDFPGVAVQSALDEGGERGTVDLIVEVNARRRLQYQIDTDNSGSPSAGRHRIGGSISIKSPLEYADNLELRAIRSFGGQLDFARLSYDFPVGASGGRSGIGFSYLHYDLGGDFAALGATGTAKVSDLSYAYPLIRLRKKNLTARFSVEHKDLNDEIASAPMLSSHKLIEKLGAGLVYEHRDNLFGGGYVGSSATLYSGVLHLNNLPLREIDQGPNGRRTQGSFAKLEFQLSRLQRLTDRSDLLLSFSGQLSRKNLDSAEKISLGGARGVRAYSSSEVLGDEGGIATLEYRYNFLPTLTVSAFYDDAWAKINVDPLLDEAENQRSLRGYGLGLYCRLPGNLSINSTLAWRRSAASRIEGEDRRPRLFLQAVWGL